MRTKILILLTLLNTSNAIAVVTPDNSCDNLKNPTDQNIVNCLAIAVEKHCTDHSSDENEFATCCSSWYKSLDSSSIGIEFSKQTVITVCGENYGLRFK